MAALRAVSVLAMLLLVAQAQNTQNGKPPNNRFNFFDVELLKEVISQEGAHNFVMSPASAKAVLAMLLEGAQGSSADQIVKALRISGSKDTYRAFFNNFLRSLSVRYPGNFIESANQLFLTPSVQPQKEYRDILNKVYLSNIQSVEFSERQMAAATINGWVAKSTHGLIHTLVSPYLIDPHSKAIVTNALYFKGKWAVPFEKKATTVRCFHIGGNCKKAYFMETAGQYMYADLKDLNAKALELHYQGSKFSMLFILPNNDIDELLRDFSFHPLNTIFPKLESTVVVVSVPRFAIEYEIDLSNSLSKLGIKDIFTPAANFSGMLEKGENVYISKLFQKAIIEVNEEGTTGAAASGAVAVPLQLPTVPKFQASRPFLFFVRDIESGNFLFEGLVEQPELADPSETTPVLPPNFQPDTDRAPPALEPDNPTVLHPVPSFENNPSFTSGGETIANRPQSAIYSTPSSTNAGGSHGSGISSTGYDSTFVTSASGHRPTTTGRDDAVHYPHV